MKEHNYVTVPGKESTCTETGLTVGMSCSVCNKVKLEQYETPALGHDIVEDPEVPATCTEPGKAAVQHCSRCNYTAGGEEIAATGHSYSYVGGSSASCTAGGYSAYRCANCGDTYSESSDALGHQWEAIEGNPYNGFACSRCGEETKCVHNWVKQPDIGASCEYGPCEFYICSNCSETKTNPLSGDPLGHNWVLYEDGGELHCTRCSATKNLTGSECEHECAEPIKQEAICNDSGYLIYTCTLCGFKYSMVTEPPTQNHSWVADSKTEPEGGGQGEQGADGIVIEKCSVCGTIRTTTIHVYKDGVCVNCGSKEMTDEYVTEPPVG